MATQLGLPIADRVRASLDGAAKDIRSTCRLIAKRTKQGDALARAARMDPGNFSKALNGDTYKLDLDVLPAFFAEDRDGELIRPHGREPPPARRAHRDPRPPRPPSGGPMKPVPGFVLEELPLEPPTRRTSDELDLDELEREAAFGRTTATSVALVVLAVVALAAAAGLRFIVQVLLGWW